jgi:hypothetical protein
MASVEVPASTKSLAKTGAPMRSMPLMNGTLFSSRLATIGYSVRERKE